MKSDISSPPLVTLALFAYNQEKYIRKAMEGAFSQTYEPLEIIFSDDCSSDQTYEIMQEVVASYDGPHSVILRRSERNRGLLTHINDASRLFSGDFVVVAAGDDISASNRVERILSTFLTGPQIFAVYSNYIDLEDMLGAVDGTDSYLELIPLSEVAFNGGGLGLGATYAYKRECFSWPKFMPAHLRSEDRILPLRAAINGKLAFIPDRLVKYKSRASGDKLADKGLGPLHLKSHVSTIVDELQSGYQQGKVRFIEYLRCRTIVILRHHTSTRRGDRAFRVFIRRATSFLLRLMIPSRKRIFPKSTPL